MRTWEYRLYKTVHTSKYALSRLKQAQVRNDADETVFWKQEYTKAIQQENQMDASGYGASVPVGNLNLNPNPGYYTGLNQTVYYTPPAPMGTVETIEQANERKELHKKTWVYFAKMFVEKYPEWDLLPDPSNPLTNTLIRSKSKDFAIENGEHGIRLMGATSHSAARIASELKLDSPTNAFTLPNRHMFYGWALDSEGVPSFLVQP